MNSVTNLLQPAIDRMGWVLIHSLWEGSLVSVIAFTGLLFMGKASSRLRYGWSYAMLLACGMAPVCTWFLIDTEPQRSSVAPPLMTGNSVATFSASKQTSSQQHLVFFGKSRATPLPSLYLRVPVVPELFLRLLVGCWAIGVIFLGARIQIGLLMLQKFGGSGAAVEDTRWHGTLDRLKKRLSTSRSIKLLESARIQTPCTFGAYRPVIFVPRNAVAGLSVAQIETIIAHELAHIQRHDYLFNLIQSIVETGLFFHPAVRRISWRIRFERELCCDDFVIQLELDREAYVDALLHLEETRPTPVFALSAAGSPLIERIRRIMGMPGKCQIPSQGSLGAAAFLGIALFGAVTAISFSHCDAQTPPKASNISSVNAKDDASPVTISGRIVSAETNQPLGGVGLRFGSVVHYHWLEGPEYTVRTNQLGEYSFTVVRKNEYPHFLEDGIKVFASIVADGYSEDEKLLGIYHPGDNAKLNFSLPTKPVIRGRVTDEAGKPVSGVQVEESVGWSHTDAFGNFVFYQTARDVSQKNWRGNFNWVGNDLKLTDSF